MFLDQMHKCFIPNVLPYNNNNDHWSVIFFPCISSPEVLDHRVTLLLSSMLSTNSPSDCIQAAASFLRREPRWAPACPLTSLWDGSPLLHCQTHCVNSFFSFSPCCSSDAIHTAQAVKALLLPLSIITGLTLVKGKTLTCTQWRNVTEWMFAF